MVCFFFVVGPPGLKLPVPGVQSRVTLVIGLRTTALKHDFEDCESIRIVRRQNRDSYMNRFVHAPLVFSSSSLKQRSIASPPLVCFLGLSLSGFLK